MTAAESVHALPKHYAWWFPGSPVKVHLDLKVVRQLGDRVQNLGVREREEGLLFGRVVEGATEVTDFKPACGSVPEMVEALSNGTPGTGLVGYYRTEDGETLRLNGNDLALAESHFNKPYQVFLVIQSAGFGPPNATFFFHEGNRQMADFPFLEFPLDISLLAAEERDRIRRSQEAAIVHQPTATATMPPAKQARHPWRFGRSMAIALGLVLFLMGGRWVATPGWGERLMAIWKAGAQPSPAASIPTPPQGTESMGLRARRQSGDLEVTWDRESPLIARATSGVISIEDGNSKRQILLDSTQVHYGSLLYSPASDQIQMELTVYSPAASNTESVLVILPKMGAPQTYALTRPASPAPPPAKEEDRPTIAATRPFTPPPPNQPTGTPRITLPSEVPAAAIPRANLPGILPFVAPAAPPPLTKQQPGQQQASGAKPAPAAYHLPEAISKALPKYPRHLQALISKPSVIEIRVQIDKSGNVTKAELIPQPGLNPFFSEPALEAARSWKFDPARRGDEAIPSESILRFVFKP